LGVAELWIFRGLYDILKKKDAAMETQLTFPSAWLFFFIGDKPLQKAEAVIFLLFYFLR
jgi:hypothetical protein